MRKIVLSGWVAVASLIVFAAGCDDECRVGATECVSGLLIRTCVPNEDGNEWLVHQCGPTERCEWGAQGQGDAGAADGGEEPAANGRDAACVGMCRLGDQRCVSPGLSQVCIAGGVWQLDACDVGEACSESEGGCVLGDGEDTVRRCEPGARACASDKVEKVCDNDGSAWVQQMCPQNQICEEDRCVPDPGSSCDDANSCLDNKTAVRCLGGDRGFELVSCEGDTYCEAGRCRGAVCALGSLCTEGEQIRECVDGTRYRDSQCAANQVCKQIKDYAMCVPKACEPGTSACGDPRDATVDPAKNFTTCIVSAGGSGVPEWVKGECSGNTTCDPARVNSGNPCSEECTKGEQRCTNDELTGVNNGIQECGDDGTWRAATSCNTGGQSVKQCVQVPSPNASELPAAVCADPICWWVWSNASAGAEGACEGEEIRRCQDDGTLADAEACTVGACRNVNMVSTADGRTPATCDEARECEEGEEVCLASEGRATPRYRSCEDGVWSVEIKTCESDGACFSTRDDAGKRRVLCGGECAPGTARCSGNRQVERCNDEGRWSSGEQCDIGQCRTLGNNDASCVLECVPGSFTCQGGEETAPDGFHSGTAQQRTCEGDGTWSDAADCPDGRTCRVTKSGISLGCVACVGPEAPGGNSEGTADSRCDPDDGARIQDCGNNNTWLSSRTCSDGKTCQAPEAQSCGMCMGVRGMFQCTDSNLRTEQICAACEVPLTGGGTTQIPVCTQTAIDATPNRVSAECTGVENGSAPGSWAGEADCCGGYQRTASQESNASCSQRNFGDPTAWGGVPDCCENYTEGAGGATFAYCD